MPGPKAIRTKYGDHLFRSRLEARWAVFFDALGIRFEYEAEGYELSDGTCYLPDFWLPTFSGGCFVEVKPRGGDYAKARQFAAESGKQMWMAEGPPGFNVTYLVGGSEDVSGRVVDTAVIPAADQAEGEDRFFWLPGYERPDGSFDPSMAGDTYVEAVRFATGYSFWEPSGPAPRRLRELLPRRPQP